MMNGDIKPGKRGMRIGLCCGFLILGLAACNLPGTGADDLEPTVTGGESQDVELGQQEQALKKGECPELWSIYALSYSHATELNISGRGDGGEEIHFKTESEPGATFYLYIDPSGKVGNDGAWENIVTINVSGWLKDDNAGSCPVQYLQGAWTLSADITGTCKKGIVKMRVTEHFEDHELTGSCGDPIDMAGQISGPEVDLKFDLSIPMTNDGITLGSEGDQRYIFYWYQLTPSDFLFDTPQTPSP
ncbi:MAG: hypothetical protein MUO58_14595 [Anaerolineales bacterium]|nr:hypothetical protein [Anaerolineales bacterium]